MRWPALPCVPSTCESIAQVLATCESIPNYSSSTYITPGGKLPDVLKSFLTKEGHIFVGAHIKNDVVRLEEDCGITITKWDDHQVIVPQVNEKYRHLKRSGKQWRSSLEHIASEVLEIKIQKHKMDHNWWHSQFLTDEQIRYATIDVFLSYEIANQLQIKHGYNFRGEAREDVKI